MCRKLPVGPSKVMVVLQPPPLISQVINSDCWAAGLASFQRVTGINPQASREGLVLRYSLCIASDPQDTGMLPEQCVRPVFAGEGCHLRRRPPAPFDYDSVRAALLTVGHLVVIDDCGGGVYHTLVLYAVGVDADGKPNKDFVSVMNPATNYLSAGYQNRTFGSLNIVSVGHRGPPSARHVHS